MTAGNRARIRSGPARQTQVPDREAEAFADRSKCSTHLIEYYVLRGEARRCPMCVMERQYDEVRADLLKTQNELQLANGQLARLQTQVDLQTAMREAIAVLDDNDFAWLKVQMYQYKIDKSVMLKPTHGNIAGGKRLRRGEKLPPNGFMTVPKRGDPEAHGATSLGGLAMAEYLDEAITCSGSAQAMGIMLKAWWKVLPGAQA